MKYYIYTITCKTTNDLYIGKTTNFKKRFANHRYNAYTKLNRKLYNMINLNGEFDNWIFTIVEEGDCDNPIEREKYFCNLMNPNLNTNIPNRSLKEYRLDNRLKYNDYMNKYMKCRNYFKRELKNYFYIN